MICEIYINFFTFYNNVLDQCFSNFSALMNYLDLVNMQIQIQ